MHEFEITAAGLVSYLAAKEPFFDGLGTSQLTLVGFPIDIDATAMTAGSFSLGGVGGFPSATVATFTLLPGVKSVQEGSGGVHEFELTVTETGVVTYAAAKEPFLDGLGTSQLTLVGYDIIIDATASAAPNYFIGGIGPFLSATVDTIRFLPGLKSITDGSPNVYQFEVLENGLLGPDVPGILSGVGTSTLTFTP